ncbi:carbon-nitrogen hydrolase [Roridomyces roridus]|uniref:Carbon-nitrogen hydrolase n=1 Tax=Roridomyces roridus TaxID=1738132 RepID=A0AAD7F7F8_9AGAR|nr:carbon-nitrogen hydrolase [Roridomyces roridus]
MDKEATTQKVIDLIRQAGERGIRLLVFPETFIPDIPYFIECYPPLKQVGAIALYAEQSVVTQAKKSGHPISCRETGVAISLGVSERMAGGFTLFNSQINLQPTYVERAVWACGSGATLKTYKTGMGITWEAKCLCCWENTMHLARQALVEQNEHIHAAAWPALSVLAGFEAVADIQIEALMKSHALMCQTFVVCASSYVDEGPISAQEGRGWSAVVHPFCEVLAGPHTSETECMLEAEIELRELAEVKVWIDAAGHYKAA